MEWPGWVFRVQRSVCIHLRSSGPSLSFQPILVPLGRTGTYGLDLALIENAPTGSTPQSKPPRLFCQRLCHGTRKRLQSLTVVRERETVANTMRVERTASKREFQSSLTTPVRLCLFLLLQVGAARKSFNSPCDKMGKCGNGKGINGTVGRKRVTDEHNYCRLE